MSRTVFSVVVLFCMALVAAVPHADAQDVKNPSVRIHTAEIPAGDFNVVARDAHIVDLEERQDINWQITIANNIIYENPLGAAVLRVYDEAQPSKFVEVGMGSLPDARYWAAVQIPDDEGYVIVHRDTERGWSPASKTIISYTENAGLTINNGARIVVTNLDIGEFRMDSYSVHGMESYSDPPAANSGTMTVEFLSGDPTKNVFALFPFYVTAAVGILVGTLYLTKRRS